jgi:hypothetical protein
MFDFCSFPRKLDMIGRIAGEIDESTQPPDDCKNPAAVAIGRTGGKARAIGYGAKILKDIEKKSDRTRWG